MVSEIRRKRLYRAKRIRAGKKIAALPLRASTKVYNASRTHYFPKMRGGHPTPPRPNLPYIFATWVCSMLAISALYAMSYYSGSILVMAPFGATCVLVFGAPDSPLAQPRNVVAGHVIAATISVALVQMFGDSWWVVALGVGTVIAVMQLTRTLHPPAGADPLVIITTHASWDFIFIPVLVGAIILVLCGVITNNFSKDKHYPKYWW